MVEVGLELQPMCGLAAVAAVAAVQPIMAAAPAPKRVHVLDLRAAADLIQRLDMQVLVVAVLEALVLMVHRRPVVQVALALQPLS
jgi:hypothetical protein